MRLAWTAGLFCVLPPRVIRTMVDDASGSQWQTGGTAWGWPLRRRSSTLSLRPRARLGRVLGFGSARSLSKRMAGASGLELRQKDTREARRFPSRSRETPGRQSLESPRIRPARTPAIFWLSPKTGVARLRFSPPKCSYEMTPDSIGLPAGSDLRL